MTVGKFIVVEGLDNVGKTTFVQYFLKQNPLVISRKFPSKHTAEVINSMIYKNIDWKHIHSIFHSNLQDGMAQIQTTLAGGDSVVCDRYVYSHFVYEALRGNNELCRFDPFVKPDVIIYLRPKYPQKLKSKDDNLERDIDFIKGQKIYDEILKDEPNVVIVPALQPDTNDEAMKALQMILGDFV